MAAKIDIDVSELVTLAQALPLSKKRIDTATARAINWAVDRGYTVLRRSLAASTGIRISDFNRTKGLIVIRARPERLTSEVVARARWTPLGYFNPTQRRKGVSARPWGKRRIFPGTFLATMSSGHQGVFQRVAVGAKPRQRRAKVRGQLVATSAEVKIYRIRELWGPSLAQELVRPPNPQAFRDTVIARLPGRMQHELGRSLAGLAKKGIPGAALD
jgi:hypothetical protein